MLTSEAERDWLESRGLKPSKWLRQEELDALEKAARAATPGPWEYDSHHPDRIYGAVNARKKHIAICNLPNKWDEERRVTHDDQMVNAAFIAAANPEVILRLIAEVRALRELRIMQEDDLK